MSRSQQLRFVFLVVVIVIAANSAWWALVNSSAIGSPLAKQNNWAPQQVPVSMTRGAQADAPRLIPFQSFLTDGAGQPVEGSHTLTFRIYDRATEGAWLWSETRPGTQVSKGVVNVMLGADTPFGSLSFDEELYVGVTVDSNPEMVPRQQLIPAIFAADADRADEAAYAVRAGDSDRADKLVIPGTMNDAVTVDAGGNIGVGQPSPAARLDVNGNVRVSGSIQTNGAVSGFGVMPIGSIVAWHKDFANTPARPDGWEECNGQVLNDPNSPYNGQTLPDLNNTPSAYTGGGRFLRGGTASGTLQGASYHFNQSCCDKYPRSSPWIVDGDGFVTRPTDLYNAVPGVPVTTETRQYDFSRPINMSVVWIMRVK